MRRILQTLLFLFALSFTQIFQDAKACNLTSLTMDNFYQSGGDWVLEATLCIGGGVTGATLGADGDTFDIAWGIYGPGGGAVTVQSFTPDANAPLLTATNTGCEMPGFDIGPVPVSPFFTQATLYYAWDPFSYPACTNGFTCVTTTALCGNVLQDCFSFVITFDTIPDSIRVFGAEGAGNPVAGCYPNPDMLIIPGVMPVIWGEIAATSSAAGNVIRWETYSESNNDHFEVMRSTEDGSFEKIGTVAAVGNSRAKLSYQFLDTHPGKGHNQYQIVQVDIDGMTDASEVVSVTYQAPQLLAWSHVGPVPTKDLIHVHFLSETEQAVRLAVVNVKGQVVKDVSVDALTGNNSLQMDLQDLEPGVYFLRLQGPNTKLDYKLIKL